MFFIELYGQKVELHGSISVATECRFLCCEMPSNLGNANSRMRFLSSTDPAAGLGDEFTKLLFSLFFSYGRS